MAIASLLAARLFPKALHLCKGADWLRPGSPLSVDSRGENSRIENHRTKRFEPINPKGSPLPPLRGYADTPTCLPIQVNPFFEGKNAPNRIHLDCLGPPSPSLHDLYLM